MPSFVILDSKLFYGGYDISGLTNSITLNYNADVPEANTLGGDGTRSRVAGLLDVSLDADGFVDQTEKDSVLFSRIGEVERGVITVGAEDGEVDDIAYFLEAQQGTYNTLGNIGEVAPYSMNASASSHPLVRGIVQAEGKKTADGTGTVRDLGALAAGSTLYASLHVVGYKGTNPTLDVKVTSSNAQAFGSPADRITFPQVGEAISGQIMTVKGAVAHRYWRVEWEIGGTDDPEYEIYVAMGVL